MKRKHWFLAALIVMVSALFGGCAMMEPTQRHHANNLFKFLYPKSASHIDTPGIPTLQLPLRVGIAFVPVDNNGPMDRSYWPEDPQFTEAQKLELLKKVSEQFKSYPFVRSIEIIPSAYLTPGGGFENLDNLRNMYGIDLITLVSYDQAQFTDEGFLSLTYWTVVGAVVMQGEKNETRTMIDAAVYDIQSRRLLFRAPGTSSVKGRSTLVHQQEELRKNSAEGFEIAATNLVPALKVQLEDFRDRVKSAPTEYKVVHRPGYTGGGAIGFIDATLFSLAIIALWTHRKHQI